MADSITSSYELSVGLDYLGWEKQSGTSERKQVTKTAYIKIPNPRANLTESEIKTAVGSFINAQIVFDPEQNPFSTSSIATAFTTSEEKINIDIEN